MNIGIIGAGSIAENMANTINKMGQHVTLLAIASRSKEKAEKFAAKFNIPKAYGSYEDMLNDSEIQLVYIATPHSHHYEHMKLCLNHNKNVLCEKSFTATAAQTKEIINLAKEKQLYVAEAIWTRYLPSRKLIDETINSGIIGKITGLTANLCYPMLHKERLIKPELAGGALLDVGVYPINFSLMHFGKDIKKITSFVQIHSSGVDGFETINIEYNDGKNAVLTAGMYARSDRKGIFWGEEGYIVVENINNPELISVYNTNDQLVKTIEIPAQITGFEYQVQEAYDQISKGKTESISMPLEETLYVMEIMDNLRKEWKVKSI